MEEELGFHLIKVELRIKNQDVYTCIPLRISNTKTEVDA